MSPPATLESRPLGKNGPVVPRLGLGLMNNSGAYNSVPTDEERFVFLDKAHAVGETFWDTGRNSWVLFALALTNNPDSRFVHGLRGSPWEVVQGQP